MSESRTPRQAFKSAFLFKCAELGMTLPETEQAAQRALQRVKSAGLVADILKPVSAVAATGRDAVGAVLRPAANYGVTGLLVGPPALGAMAGYGLSKLTDLDDTDVAAIRDRELIEEYQRQAERLRSRRKGHSA